MHPQLIPERHPKCGKVMEALVKCREANPVNRFWGACNEVTYELSKCLVAEKKEARAPRQAKFHEKWAERRAEHEANMADLEAQEAARKAAQTAQAGQSDEAMQAASNLKAPMWQGGGSLASKPDSVWDVLPGMPSEHWFTGASGEHQEPKSYFAPENKDAFFYNKTANVFFSDGFFQTPQQKKETATQAQPQTDHARHEPTPSQAQ